MFRPIKGTEKGDMPFSAPFLTLIVKYLLLYHIRADNDGAYCAKIYFGFL